MKSKPDFASMMALRQYIHNTIIGGVFFLIPLFVLLMVAQKVWAFFRDLGGNLAKTMGYEQVAGVASESILSAFLILLVCFLFALLAKWSMATGVRNWFESGLKRTFPFYDYYKTLIEQKLDPKEKPRPPRLCCAPSGRLAAGYPGGRIRQQRKNGICSAFA